jgi:hypothetical protein
MDPSTYAEWTAFVAAVERRLKVGAEEYGDRSFDRPAPELLRELREELYDVMGWGFILHSRIKNIEKRLSEIGVG